MIAMATIDRDHLRALHQLEEERFVELHPRSAVRAEHARTNLVAGVPMAWMTRLPGAFPVFFDTARGAEVTDVDGLGYIDFCLGDTGAMTGHGLVPLADALSAQARRGITTMLPNDDAAWVGAELARRFGLPRWQMAMTATDANRFVLRFARHLTGRPKVLVFDWCYHGTVDEALATLDDDGNVVRRAGNIGPAFDPATTTKVVQFNDLAALEAALADRSVAAVLMEPALTNIGIVLPEPGFLDGVRAACDRTGTLLVIDETHTICVGPGGATAAWGLRPDLFVIGKTIGGGMPVAAYGMTEAVADQLQPALVDHDVDVSGIGGTLTGNALAIAAVRTVLSSTLRDEDYARMIPLAESWTQGVAATIAEHDLPWHVQRLGCRAEYWFCEPPRNGRDAAAAVDHELDAFMHLYAMNRGVLLTPFHNMALMSPFHTQAHVDRHTELFASAVGELVGAKIPA